MSKTKKGPFFYGQANQQTEAEQGNPQKKSHLKRAIIKLQKNVKALVLERELWSREKGRGFSLLRPNTQTGHWEFIQNERSIVLKSGIKTAANEIEVWENKKLLSCHEITDLKLIDASLRRLKTSLEKLPIRHRKNRASKAKRNEAPKIPSFLSPEKDPFFAIKEKLATTGIEFMDVTLEKTGVSSKGSAFMIIDFKNCGTMIWIKEEPDSPYWYSNNGDDASPNEISQMILMLNKIPNEMSIAV